MAAAGLLQAGFFSALAEIQPELVDDTVTTLPSLLSMLGVDGLANTIWNLPFAGLLAAEGSLPSSGTSAGPLPSSGTASASLRLCRLGQSFLLRRLLL